MSKSHNIPLQVVRPRILMLPLRTKRTSITWALMHKSVPYHLILSFEAFAAFGTRAAGKRAVMRARGGVDICVGALVIQVVSRCSYSHSSGRVYFESEEESLGEAVEY